MNISTTKGLIDIDQLEIVDNITLEDNARICSTEWYLEGELVRRDCNINVLRGLSLVSEATQL